MLPRLLTCYMYVTAGGKVYAWGFGMDGQLGLGSVVMATRPRRLRHSFLEAGASSVACGDVFSAVVTGKRYLHVDIVLVAIAIVVVNVIIIFNIVVTISITNQRLLSPF